MEFTDVMQRELICDLAKKLMSCPTAPYFERDVQLEVKAIAREHRLQVEADRFGNLWVRNRRKSGSGRPVVLVAHMDHPGFHLLAGKGEQGPMVSFRGGVPDSYFRAGTRIELFPGGDLWKLVKAGADKRTWTIGRVSRGAKEPGEVRFGMWALPAYREEKNEVHGRACDDLIGVASILAVLIGLKGRRANVVGLLTRAEEVGFVGALGVAREGLMPRDALVVSLEASQERAGARLHGGVVLRVGDKMSIFDSRATRYLQEVAQGMAEVEGFEWQRALMGGGTCEATVFSEYGYQTAAVCVPLGNYHNCGKGGRIREEYVSIQDVVCQVQLLEEAVGRMKEFERLVEKVPKRLEALWEKGGGELGRGEDGGRAVVGDE